MIRGVAGLTSPRPSWWARFRTWPVWAQAAAWLFALLPLVLLAARPVWRAATVLLAVTWVAAAAVPIRLWIGTGVGLATLGLLHAIVFVLPRRLVAPGTLTEEQLHKARNDARSGLLAALGGAVALAGAFTGGYVGLKQLQVNREGQITERFTRAIDQLGSEQLDVRVGGIYALERIAKDSKPDHSPVVEILSAFLRGHSLDRDLSAPASQDLHPPKGVKSPRLPSDVQAALKVLEQLDLSNVDLQTAHLPSAYLPAANLQWINLHGADLLEANLQGADLREANLQVARLLRVNLLGADLRMANLRRADLQGADLKLANLEGADLRMANLVGANLEWANLDGAHVYGASLENANLQGASLEGAVLREANLRGARANSATRWPKGFDPARAGVRICAVAEPPEPQPPC